MECTMIMPIDLIMLPGRSCPRRGKNGVRYDHAYRPHHATGTVVSEKGQNGVYYDHAADLIMLPHCCREECTRPV